jgi:hypothetical protein
LLFGRVIFSDRDFSFALKARNNGIVIDVLVDVPALAVVLFELAPSEAGETTVAGTALGELAAALDDALAMSKGPTGADAVVAAGDCMRVVKNC